MKEILLCFLMFFMSSVYSETIEFVVKANAGGPDDILTRKIAQHLEQNTTDKFVVINKPGASHTIGYSYFEKNHLPTLIIADVNIQKYPANLNSENLFTLGTFTNILFVRKGSGINTLDDLKHLSNTREVKFGHGGVGTFSYLAAEKICDNFLRCLLVPYKSGSPGMIDLASGEIDAFSLISYGASSALTSNYYTPLVAYSNTKHPKLNVPILPSSLKKLEIKNWIAIYSRNLNEKQKQSIIKALTSMDKEFFLENGLWSD